MDVAINQIKQHEETLDNVAREFLTMLLVVGEKVGDKTLLKMLEDTKQRLEKKTATPDTDKLKRARNLSYTRGNGLILV